MRTVSCSGILNGDMIQSYNKSSSATHIKATVLVHMQQIQSYNIRSIATHQCALQIKNISYNLYPKVRSYGPQNVYFISEKVS